MSGKPLVSKRSDVSRLIRFGKSGSGVWGKSDPASHEITVLKSTSGGRSPISSIDR